MTESEAGRNQECRACIEPRKMYSRGPEGLSVIRAEKADAVDKAEGGRPGNAMAGIQVTTGV